MAPFVVFSLPRSRSAWLSVFLSRPYALVGHDIGITCRTPEDFAERLKTDLAGTCETGAMFAWRLIRKMLPDARFVVVRRPVSDVIDSLRKCGLYGLEEEMERRNALLDEIAAEDGVLSVRFEHLDDLLWTHTLYASCTGEPLTRQWHEHMGAMNVQVDMATRLSLLAMSADRIACLKAEVARQLADA
jgi:hypothetical protein